MPPRSPIEAMHAEASQTTFLAKGFSRQFKLSICEGSTSVFAEIE